MDERHPVHLEKSGLPESLRSKINPCGTINRPEAEESDRIFYCCFLNLPTACPVGTLESLLVSSICPMRFIPDPLTALFTVLGIITVVFLRGLFRALSR